MSAHASASSNDRTRSQELRDVGSTPAADSLTWTQASRYHLVSDCGRYVIAKVIVLGVTRYEAWRREPALRICSLEAADQAKDAAQAFHDGGTRGSR